MHYRLYMLNPSTGRIVSGSDVTAASEDDAIAQAHALLDATGAPFELWRGTRCVFAHAGSQG